MATKNNNDMTLERTLWETAESMRAKGNQEASEYKHVVLGLVFLKYVSDKFSERRQELTRGAHGRRYRRRPNPVIP